MHKLRPANLPRSPAIPMKIDKPLQKDQIKQLRALAHGLKPVVRLGQHGLTTAVTAELERSLEHHELVKVKLSGEGRDARQAQLDALCKATGAVTVQSIGHTACLFRRNQKKPVITLN